MTDAIAKAMDDLARGIQELEQLLLVARPARPTRDQDPRQELARDNA